MYRGRLLMGYRAFHLLVIGLNLACVGRNRKPLLFDRCQKPVWKEHISHLDTDPDGWLPKSDPLKQPQEKTSFSSLSQKALS